MEDVKTTAQFVGREMNTNMVAADYIQGCSLLYNFREKLILWFEAIKSFSA
jgi:hypothetical protein